jgi:hypothetical protein
MKKRKLYQVRYFEGAKYSKAVGSGRFVPRLVANRIARRLKARVKRAKLDILIVTVPVTAYMTPEQSAYLERRYGA